MKSLTTKKKIIFIIGAIILLSILSIIILQASQSKIKKLNDLKLYTNMIQNSTLKMQNDQKDYIIYRDAKYLHRFDDNYNALSGDMKKLQSLLKELDIEDKRGNELLVALKNYKTKFHQMVSSNAEDQTKYKDIKQLTNKIDSIFQKETSSIDKSISIQNADESSKEITITLIYIAALILLMFYAYKITAKRVEELRSKNFSQNEVDEINESFVSFYELINDFHKIIEDNKPRSLKM